MVASKQGLAQIIVPTSASTDAPTSAMSILYQKDGTYDCSVHHKRGAELILVDTEIIAKAPLRLFVAGIGDALATYLKQEPMQPPIRRTISAVDTVKPRRAWPLPEPVMRC